VIRQILHNLKDAYLTREWFSTHLAEDIAFEMDHPFPVGGRGRRPHGRRPRRCAEESEVTP
jgi:hypothetical protein